MFDFLPESIKEFMVALVTPFVGEGWHLTLGAVFMIVVIFLPGGVMQGLNKLFDFIKRIFGMGVATTPTADTVSKGDA